MRRSFIFFLAANFVMAAVAEEGAGQGVRPIVRRSMPPPTPTSPGNYLDPRLPQPPTPGGPLPNTTLLWPYGALPYYYQVPAYDWSPYTRYLDSLSWWNQPQPAAPPIYIRTPSYIGTSNEPWPYNYAPLR